AELAATRAGRNGDSADGDATAGSAAAGPVTAAGAVAAGAVAAPEPAPARHPVDPPVTAATVG
ncbi:hypothetical protein, partial [Candidatus Protofrankia datiscae]